VHDNELDVHNNELEGANDAGNNAGAGGCGGLEAVRQQARVWCTFICGNVLQVVALRPAPMYLFLSRDVDGLLRLCTCFGLGDVAGHSRILHIQLSHLRRTDRNVVWSRLLYAPRFRSWTRASEARQSFLRSVHRSACISTPV
jgi:hypothetical protein